ncbi:glycosyltransferase family 4 protein [Glutamicibacter ardleyensis]|uniref:glycosyltransferase family 4 protein n=1 Tax=Glutamicibacter ardleyensis TaxID=225894 RepID=UPI003FD219FE
MTNINGGIRHVWFVNHHAVIPSKDGGTGRHLNMAAYLPEHGWSASLILSSTLHPSGQQSLNGLRMRKISDEGGVPALWIRTNAYGRNMLLRMVGMAVFAFMLLFPRATRGLERPDVIVGSTVHPLAAWAAWRLSKRYRVPFVYEIRDVWPDTLIDLGRLSQDGLISRAMEWLSVLLAKNAKLVVSPLPAVDRYLISRNVTDVPFLWVSNGIDEKREIIQPGLPVRKSVTFMYLGAHGNANALAELIQAYDQSRSLRPELDIFLRLVGDGPLKPSLMKMAAALEAGPSISFEDQIPSTEVVERSREADFLIANMFDKPVYRFGISLNKLFSYMYAFRPIIFASSAINNPIREANAGITVPADNRESLVDAFVRACDSTHEQRLCWAKNGYEYVLAGFSHEALARKLVQGLNSVLDDADESNQNEARS